MVLSPPFLMLPYPVIYLAEEARKWRNIESYDQVGLVEAQEMFSNLIHFFDVGFVSIPCSEIYVLIKENLGGNSSNSRRRRRSCSRLTDVWEVVCHDRQRLWFMISAPPKEGPEKDK